MNLGVVITQARIPAEVHKALKDEAYERRISMNSMIVEILKKRYMGDVGNG